MSNTELQTPKITALPTATVRVTEARPLDAADAIVIHELINRVYLAEDSRDREALQQIVTEDYVQHHSLYGSLEGREAFTSFVLDNPTYFDGLRHQAFSIATKSEGLNQASAVSYILVLQVFSNDPAIAPSLPRIIGQGVVKDQFVKREGQWLLSNRVYEQFSLLPAIAPGSELRIKASAQVLAE